MNDAIKDSPKGGTIELALEYLTDCVKLWVKDEGIGIPLHEREHLFEAFYRVNHVSTIQGTGLGLAIVKKCVELRRADITASITVESSVGVGTVFTVILPCNA